MSRTERCWLARLVRGACRLQGRRDRRDAMSRLQRLGLVAVLSRPVRVMGSLRHVVIASLTPAGVLAAGGL